MADRVAIVAAAQTQFRPRRPEVNYAEMVLEVVEKVLDETGLELGRTIDNTVSCSHDIWDGQTISDIGITDVVGGHLGAEEKVAMDGATAVYYAAIGILSGHVDCTLCVAHTKMSQTRRNLVNNIAFDPLYTRPLGLDFTSAAALQANRYMHRYGVSERDTAKVVVQNLGNARHNPVAFRRESLTVDDVLSSPVVARPLKELDIAPDADGAVALILASEKVARGVTKTPVWVAGMGACYDAHYLGDRDLSDCFALEQAASQAYKMAGIRDPRKQIHVIELSDEFSYQELMWLEGMGICTCGHARTLIEDGATSLDGTLPVNPSGGLLAGVPTNVAGLNRVAEAVLQLLGKAQGYQVAHARTALAQGHTGICGQHHCVIILKRD
jgi:acetyl-CoA C-acetyltransferase